MQEKLKQQEQIKEANDEMKVLLKEYQGENICLKKELVNIKKAFVKMKKSNEEIVTMFKNNQNKLRKTL